MFSRSYVMAIEYEEENRGDKKGKNWKITWLFSGNSFQFAFFRAPKKALRKSNGQRDIGRLSPFSGEKKPGLDFSKPGFGVRLSLRHAEFRIDSCANTAHALYDMPLPRQNRSQIGGKALSDYLASPLRIAACAAARRAIGTRNGEQDT